MPTWAVFEPVHIYLVKVPTAKPAASSLQDLRLKDSPALLILGLECKPRPVFSGKVGRDHQALRMMRVPAPSLGGTAGE